MRSWSSSHKNTENRRTISDNGTPGGDATAHLGHPILSHRAPIEVKEEVNWNPFIFPSQGPRAGLHQHVCHRTWSGGSAAPGCGDNRFAIVYCTVVGCYKALGADAWSSWTNPRRETSESVQQQQHPRESMKRNVWGALPAKTQTLQWGSSLKEKEKFVLQHGVALRDR
eukprot:3159613-Amphidinium_carterae.2